MRRQRRGRSSCAGSHGACVLINRGLRLKADMAPDGRHWRELLNRLSPSLRAGLVAFALLLIVPGTMLIAWLALS